MTRRRWSEARGFGIAGQLALVCVLSIPSGRALAEAHGDGLTTTFTIDDVDPESHVPMPQEAIRAPLQMGYWVMLVSDRAEAATKRGDLAAAAKYYRAIAKAVPDRAVGFKRMCATYEAMGDWENAVGSCQVALEKVGVTTEDFVRFVQVLLAKKTPLVAAEIADADAVIAHVQESLAKPATESSAILVERLKCQVGARLEDRKRLEACVRALRAKAPKDPNTVAFAFALALTKHDFDQAERLIAGAKQSGVNDAGVAFMQDRLRLERDRSPLWKRVFGTSRVLVPIAAFLALLVAVGFFARRSWLGLRRA